MPLRLDNFVLTHCKTILNKFVNDTDGFYSQKHFYQDTDSLHIQMDHIEELKEAG